MEGWKDFRSLAHDARIQTKDYGVPREQQKGKFICVMRVVGKNGIAIEAKGGGMSLRMAKNVAAKNLLFLLKDKEMNERARRK